MAYTLNEIRSVLSASPFVSQSDTQIDEPVQRRNKQKPYFLIKAIIKNLINNYYANRVNSFIASLMQLPLTDIFTPSSERVLLNT